MTRKRPAVIVEEPDHAPFLPAVPQSLDELGLPRSLLIDLALRFCREHGTVSISSLRRSVKISYAVAQSVFEHLREQQLVEVKATAGNDYMFHLTGAARQLAAERSAVCRYAGPAPVPLTQYARVVQAQHANMVPAPEQLHNALSDLVLAEGVVERLGAALASRRPLFIYGPTGNGKTSIIERLVRVYGDTILVPYAMEVDGHIVSVFDPLVHRPVPSGNDEEIDPRWIRCRRPCVIAAGELVLSMLNLRLDEPSGVYAAPLQMKAANGMLLIDDFGRQAVSPRELFNRWILPLDRRVDCLSLHYGYTFQIPFDLTLVFATNLHPTDLVDEAFLRRVPNKIFVGAVTPEMFDAIFERVLAKQGLPFDPAMAASLRELCRSHGAAELRACYPHDICELLESRAAYRREPAELSREHLRAAAEQYFTQPEE
jgi:predicted ATPase with chaperone activity